MNLIRAKYAPKTLIDNFLKHNEDIDQTALLAKGYVTEMNDQLTGCFILEPLTEHIYWLKQLYITHTEAIKLPILVEAILALAKELRAEKVFVNSHQVTLDIILQALQFYPQPDCEVLDKYPKNVGRWWSYQVS